MEKRRTRSKKMRRLRKSGIKGGGSDVPDIRLGEKIGYIKRAMANADRGMLSQPGSPDAEIIIRTCLQYYEESYRDFPLDILNGFDFFKDKGDRINELKGIYDSPWDDLRIAINERIKRA